MFGYIITYPPEMKVKEEKLYKAIYCGLCRQLKKIGAYLIQPLLSYDFVFLAAVRMAFANEEIKIISKRCLIHPLKKRKMIDSSESLEYAAKAHLFLIYFKLLDDIGDPDSSFIKKAGYRSYLLLIKPKIKKLCKDKEYEEYFMELSRLFSEFSEKESKSSNLDEMCKSFGNILSYIASFGIEGDNKRILARLGDMLGRYIYTIDAADDLERDEKSSSFNPILIEYGSAAAAMEHISQIDMVMALYISEMKLCTEFISASSEYRGIINNIFDFGLKNSFEKVIKSKMEKNNEKSL